MKVWVLVVLLGRIAYEDVAASKECQLFTGEGASPEEVWIGDLRRDECIQACIKRKHDIDDSINGVTVFSNPNKQGCYCEKGMRYRDTNTKYKSCFFKLTDINANIPCKLYLGNGRGGDWFKIKDLPAKQCIQACIKRKRDVDDSITGVTIYTDPNEHGCYCEIGMTYRNDDSSRKSCFLRVPDVHKHEQCKIFNGDGEGGYETWVGYLNRKECIKTCIKRKKNLDDSINGVLVRRNHGDKGCFCESGMTYRSSSSKWASCFLKLPDYDSLHECKLYNGDGKGGDEINLGDLTRKECIKTCLKRKRTMDDSINGVTVRSDPSGRGCYCEQAMTYRDTSSSYVSCFLRDSPPKLRCKGRDNGCCTRDHPCDVGEGDCDSDAECLEGLVCGLNNCPWGDNDDCCKKR